MNWYPPTPPWSTNEERLVTDALNSVANLPSEKIAQIRPPIPSIQNPFPPRFGYRTGQPGIREIISVDRVYPDNRTYLSGGPAGYEATSRPSMGYQ